MWLQVSEHMNWGKVTSRRKEIPENISKEYIKNKSYDWIVKYKINRKPGLMESEHDHFIDALDQFPRPYIGKRAC